MKKRISFILSLSIALTAFAGVTTVAAEENYQAEYWVSTTGNDSNAGTEAAPFKTVEKARDTIRELTKTGNIVVNIEPGNYYFDETLTFTADDSGADGYTVTYKSSGDAGAVNFIGGKAVTEWTQYKNGIYYTDIDSTNPIYMIYENGESNSYPARYPNFEYSEEFPTAKAPYLYAKGGKANSTSNSEGQDYDVEITAEDANTLESILPKNNDMYDLRLVIWPGGRWDWSMEMHKLSCIHLDKNWINVPLRMQYSANLDTNGKHGGSRYYFTGHLNFLDTAGEFYMDTTYFRLYYKPYDTANLTNGNIIIPTVDTVMSITADADNTAKNIAFEGITFKNTDFVDTVGFYISTSVSPAVRAKNVENVDFSSCVIKDVAGDGIVMSGVVKNCNIANSHFKNIGRDGINIKGNDVYGTKVASDASAQQNEINNCLIEYIGTTLGQGVGIVLANNYNSKISHCTLRNGARTGIVLKRNGTEDHTSEAVDLGGNLVEYVLIDGFGQDSGDTAGIHLIGIASQGEKMTSNIFNQIYIKKMKAHASINDHQPSGFYTDYGSDCQIIKNILVEDFGYWPRVWYSGSTMKGWPKCENHELENVSWVTADGPVSMVSEKWEYSTAEKALANFDETKMELDKIGVDADTFTFADEL